MSRRPRFNLLLMACAAALGAGLWLSRPAAPPTPSRPLLNIERSAIQRIEIHPGGGRAPIVLARGDNGWMLQKPVQARANEQRVDAILAMAMAVPARRYAAAEIDARQAGLAAPRATIRFGDAPALRIGARSPLNTRRDTRYVRVGDTIALTTLAHVNLLDLAWPQWLDPHILAANTQLTALQLPQLTLRRAPTGGWRVTPKARDRGADAAQLTIDAWQHARAVRITRAGDKPAMGQVTFKFANGRKRRLAVVARTPQLLLRDPALGITYHLRANRATPLLDMRHPSSALNTTKPQRSRDPRPRTSPPAMRQ